MKSNQDNAPLVDGIGPTTTTSAAVATKLARDPTNPDSQPSQTVMTDDGKACQFPFLFKGKKYYDCINLEEPTGKYWCCTSDTHDYDQQPFKGFCIDERNQELAKNPLDQTSTKVPAVDSERLEEQDRLREALDPYNSLRDPLKPKDAASEEKLKQLIEQEKVQNGDASLTPLMSTNPDPEQALNPAQPEQIGNPYERRKIMTEAGVPCVFPFIHNSKSYFDCTNEEGPATTKFWCSLTNNFDRDKKFGECIDPRNENADGATSGSNTEAQLKLDALKKIQGAGNPLGESITRHKTINLSQPLSRKDYLHLAGEELVSKDSGLKTYGGNSRGAARCAIPFIYNRKSHFSCIQFVHPNNKGDSWCATSHNFDKDMKWGLCCTSSKCGSSWAD
jgi:Fibronectin type II domain.